MFTKKVEKWLIKSKATPTEWEIYLICSNFSKPFRNGNVLEYHLTSRTNIRQHLSRMIKKGLIIRHGFHTYLVKKP